MFAYHTPVIIFLGRKDHGFTIGEEVPVAAGEIRERCDNELCIESESLKSTRREDLLIPTAPRKFP